MREKKKICENIAIFFFLGGGQYFDISFNFGIIFFLAQNSNEIEGMYVMYVIRARTDI
jgi:hypothetical protein